jgi:nitroreductase
VAGREHAGADEVGLLEGLATTRAIRRFTDEPVADEDLAAVMWAATRAPSGSNRQPFRFVVLRDGPGATEAKAVLGRAFRASWAEKVAADGYREGSGAGGDSAKARMARAMQQFVDRFEAIPVVVLACFGRHRAPHVSEGASVYPACQNLLLAARARGLGGVLTMWHQPVEDELRALLGIPADVVVAATIPLGHPEGGHGPVRRRPFGDLVYEDRWEGVAPWAVDPAGTRFTAAGPPKGPDRQR